MKIVGKVSSRGGTTVKYIQETSDRFLVEATYINRPEKHIVCFSSQVGCAIGCTFCVSGARKEGAYQRSLTAVELMQQCQNIVDAELGSVSRKAPVEKPLLFSCMGEGEPFLNFKACVSAFHELGRRSWPVPVVRIAVSTSGIRPDLIRRLGEIVFTLPVKLQISLHGPNDEIRRRVVPHTKPLAEILGATRYYRKRCDRPIDLNYVMCEGINDDLEHAELLAKLLGRGWHVKFTRLNPTPASSLQPATGERIRYFRNILEAGGISTEYYKQEISDFPAACGQLSYRYQQP